MTKHVGFIGVGAMGEPMAAALLRAGFAVSVCAHRNRAPVERLVALGATDGGDPAGVARASEVVVLCVPDAPQVEEALFGERGVVAGALLRQAQHDTGAQRDTGAQHDTGGLLVIDMSTISPVATRGFEARLRERGVRFVDAPVSGGPARAASGTLTIMVGASEDDYAQAEPVLRAMGTPRRLGPVGMGEVVKLVNQIIISNVMVANAEALVFAAKAGADVAAVREVILSATGANYLLDKWLPTTWLDGHHQAGFALDLLRKDLAAALDSARAMKVPMPASSLAYQLYTATSGEGHGGDDYSAVAQFYQRAADVQVAVK